MVCPFDARLKEMPGPDPYSIGPRQAPANGTVPNSRDDLLNAVRTAYPELPEDLKVYLIDFGRKTPES